MITTNYTEVLYYSYSDYQGSLIALTDADGSVVERYAYDPWGARRNPDNWTLAATPPSGGWGAMLVNRGYTGHEHLDAFGIINMNGRVYDPLTAMFFSPDPYVQAPDKWLNYNRYGYCYGNPFKYTDPSGEIFGSLFGFISDLVNNIFVRTFKGDKWDWTQTKLGWEIDKGLFHTDQNKSIGGRIWEFVSRLTWQLPQTLAGDLFVSSANAFGQVNNVTHNYGMTAVDMGLDNSAVTIGNFTAGPKGYTADWHDHLFVHEYGHYIQSQQHGPQ